MTAPSGASRASGCVAWNGAIICGVGAKPTRRRILACPTCKRGRRMVERWGGAWYGPTITCCGCGDSWSDGEMLERPFRRGWRKESIGRAVRDWYEAQTPAEYRRHVRFDFEQATAANGDSGSSS